MPALAVQTCPAREIIVVDNASTDDSVEWLAAHFPDVRVICVPSNIGFAAGNDLGIDQARGEFIATLNTDTEVEPDYLERLAAPMRAPRVGACAALMLDFAQRDRIDSAGICLDYAGFAWNLQAGERLENLDEPHEVWGACAGAALYRRAMLDEIGLFDAD